MELQLRGSEYKSIDGRSRNLWEQSGKLTQRAKVETAGKAAPKGRNRNCWEQSELPRKLTLSAEEADTVPRD